MPKNPFIIATKTSGSEVHLFDYRNHPAEPPLNGTCSPRLRLRGHNDHGFGLSWNKFKHTILLSGSDDAKICLWDINGTPKDNALDPILMFKAHEGPVKDVAWHCKHDYLFGSCGTDQYLNIFDLRSPSLTKPNHTLKAHQSQINCLEFHPFDEWLVATGSSDNTMKLFDLRKFTTAFHTFNSAKGEVVQVGWSPQDSEVLASSCAGRRLSVWDLTRIGGSQISEDDEGGPPELIILSGNTSKVSDISWNSSDDWLIASVSHDKMLHVWQVNEGIYNEPEENAKGG